MNICNASAFSMWVFVFCIACNRHTSVHVWAYVVACAMHNVIMYVWLGYVMYGWIQGSMGYAEDTVCLAGSYSQRIGVLWCFVEVQLLVSSCISTLNLVYIYIYTHEYSAYTHRVMITSMTKWQNPRLITRRRSSPLAPEAQFLAQHQILLESAVASCRFQHLHLDDLCTNTWSFFVSTGRMYKPIWINITASHVSCKLGRSNFSTNSDTWDQRSRIGNQGVQNTCDIPLNPDWF